jgi:hypothetical protein
MMGTAGSVILKLFSNDNGKNKELKSNGIKFKRGIPVKKFVWINGVKREIIKGELIDLNNATPEYFTLDMRNVTPA